MAQNIWGSIDSLQSATLYVYPLDTNNYTVRDNNKTNPKGFVVDGITANYAYLSPAASGADVEGVLYYDSTAHKLKIRTAAAFETISSA